MGSTTVYMGTQLKVGHLTASATAADVLTYLNDDTYDELRLAAGTYSIGLIQFQTARTRPILMCPEVGAAGAVIMTPGGASGQFAIGDPAGSAQGAYLTVDGLIFDGWVLGGTAISNVGLFTLYYGHNIAANHITVRNSTGNREFSWCWYLSSDASHGGHDTQADNWTVHGTPGYTLSGVKSDNNPNWTGFNYVRYWTVDTLSYAFYGTTSNAQGVVMDGWTIDNCTDGHASPSCVYFNLDSGVGNTIRNCTATNSAGASIDVGLDGGGNSFSSASDPAWAVSLRASFSGISYTNYTVPNSIVHDGSVGVRDELQAFIDSVPDGADATHHSRIIFPTGYTYMLDDADSVLGLLIQGRHNLTLDGTGCNIDYNFTAEGLGGDAACWFLADCVYVRILGFSIDGNNPFTGSTAAWTYVVGTAGGREGNTPFLIRSNCDHIEVGNVTVDNAVGFGVLICALGNTPTRNWPQDVWFHDFYIRGGETFGIVDGRRILLERMTLKDSIGTAFDIEAEKTTPGGSGCADVLFQDNIIDTWGWVQTLSCWFVAINPDDLAIPVTTINRVTIRRNHIIRGPSSGTLNGNYPGTGGMAFGAYKSNPKNDVVFQDNISDDDSVMVSGGGRAVMKLDSFNNLTITGNTQILTGVSHAPLTLITNSTGVTVSGNTT